MTRLRPALWLAAFWLILVVATGARSASAPMPGEHAGKGESASIRERSLGVGSRVSPDRKTTAPSERKSTSENETSQAMRIIVSLTFLAIIPAVLVCATAFLRIVIVLSMLRHAIGLPDTPPNTVLILLAMFLTVFTMGPVIGKLNDASLQPFLRGELTMSTAYEHGMDPLRDFMLRQTKGQDLELMAELNGKDRENEAVPIAQVIPAFMLSELRTAFQIGVLVFLPFLLVDLVVASVLMALGMMMVPPATIALPLKLLMFVLVDGWSLLLRALVGSFH